MKNIIIAILISLITFSAVAQVPVDTAYRLPVNEKLHYKIYYELGRIWINAGVANFQTDTLTKESTLLYRFTADGYSLNKYNWIYSLEDHYKSMVNYKTLMPVRFEKENTERGEWVHNIYNFDTVNHKVDMFMEATGKHPSNITKEFEGFITDALSAIYYLRTWDFNSFAVGDTLVFKTILDGKIFNQSLIYLGKDVVKTSNGKEVNSFKLGALIENSTFFRGDEAVQVWITDTPERWLAVAKAKIVVGSIIVYLDKQGLISFGPEK